MEPQPPPEPAILAYDSGVEPYSAARQGRISARIMVGLACWAAGTLLIVVILAGNSPNPAVRAVALMGGILGVLWNLAGGLLQRRFRDPVRRRVQASPGGWRLKFVLFCTLLALAEEAITTGLTNLAPAFGVPYGQAYITASGNYLDVVCLHSVVVFVPMFACWSWLLARYDFHPNTVFVLFGLTGTFAEMSFGGPLALLNAGFWSYIYGLMIYLPAYSMPRRETLRPPRPWHYLVAVFFPVLWVAPVAGVVGKLHPVKIHFPPMQSHLPESRPPSVEARAWTVEFPLQGVNRERFRPHQASSDRRWADAGDPGLVGGIPARLDAGLGWAVASGAVEPSGRGRGDASCERPRSSVGYPPAAVAVEPGSTDPGPAAPARCRLRCALPGRRRSSPL